MLNSLIARLLGSVGTKLDGYKTIIAGVGSILFGAAGIIHLIFPNDTDFCPNQTVDESITYIISGFALLGIGHKLDKNTKAVQESSQPKGE